MSVYITARTTVTDRKKYENEFLPAIRKIHEAHGAKIIAAGYIEGRRTSRRGRSRDRHRMPE